MRGDVFGFLDEGEHFLGDFLDYFGLLLLQGHGRLEVVVL